MPLGCVHLELHSPSQEGFEKTIPESVLTSSQQHLQFLNIFPKRPETQRGPPTLRSVRIRKLWKKPSALTACVKILPYS